MQPRARPLTSRPRFPPRVILQTSVMHGLQRETCAKSPVRSLDPAVIVKPIPRVAGKVSSEPESVLVCGVNIRVARQRPVGKLYEC